MHQGKKHDAEGAVSRLVKGKGEFDEKQSKNNTSLLLLCTIHTYSNTPLLTLPTTPLRKALATRSIYVFMFRDWRNA